jgi:UDP-N-acetylmuramyl pentapeptide phosphotransferase/UDP-N-acetylglucosamine-1-phosphate transferase
MAEESQRPDDELLAQGEDLEARSAAARLFDVRRVIGGLFIVYGVIVTLIGLFDDSAEIDKAQGVRINLWMGLGMLVLGLLFLLWLRLNPPKPVAPPSDDDRSGPVPGGH